MFFPFKSARESFAAAASLASNTSASSARFSAWSARTFSSTVPAAAELVARDDARLADAMGAVSGLGLGGGIPPRIEVHHSVGAGEVEAGAAGFEREQENGRGRGGAVRRVQS